MRKKGEAWDERDRGNGYKRKCLELGRGFEVDNGRIKGRGRRKRDNNRLKGDREKGLMGR